MFTYTVYGVTPIPRAENYRAVTPVAPVPEVGGTARGTQIGRTLGTQTQQVYLNTTPDHSPANQRYSREFTSQVTRTSMDHLQFMGTRQLLLEMRSPEEYEPDYIDKYIDQLDDYAANRSVSMENASECPDASSPLTDANKNPCDAPPSSGSSGTSSPYAAANAAAAVLS